MTQQRWSGPSWKHGNGKRFRKKREAGKKRYRECRKLHAIRQIEQQSFFRGVL